MERYGFTIFIPSYNGGRFLRQCVSSALAQPYNDFEVAVLDDGSTDGSLEWLAGLKESRLKIYPSEHVGIVDNWRKSLHVPKLEYLTIIGQDDLLDDNYLPVMAKLIEQHPEAGLFHAHFRFIDTSGKLVRPCGALPEVESAAEYITELFSDRRDTYGTGYLMKSERYDAAGGIPPFPSLLFADDALWIAMMQGSYKATAPQECFACRLDNASAGRSARWELWLAAMRDYIPFLKEVAARDAEFAAALEAYGPTYFTNYCRSLLMLANVQASKMNLRMERDVAARLAEVLAVLAPDNVAEFQEFQQSKSYRMRDIINRNALTRFGYNAFMYGKHGEWRGKRVR